jgi:hypothetical protein
MRKEKKVKAKAHQHKMPTKFDSHKDYYDEEGEINDSFGSHDAEFLKLAKELKVDVTTMRSKSKTA